MRRRRLVARGKEAGEGPAKEQEKAAVKAQEGRQDMAEEPTGGAPWCAWE